MPGVGRERLCDSNEANLPLPAHLLKRRENIADCIIVIFQRNSVEMKEIDNIRIQTLKALLDSEFHFLWCSSFSLFRDLLLGRDQNLLPAPTAHSRSNDSLGSISLGGIDQIDSPIQRPLNERNRFLLAFSGRSSQQAVSPCPQPDDAGT